MVRAGNITIDPNRYEVRIDERPVTLSPKEFELLRFFVTHPGQVFTRQVLLDRVWGAEASCRRAHGRRASPLAARKSGNQPVAALPPADRARSRL